ncbi:MAG: hypothetical protein MJZ68_04500 [archaeon]|nr:hypothetical protein [archaeon]
MKIDRLAITAVVLCAIVFIGEYTTYYTEPDDREIDAAWNGNNVTLTLKSTGSDWYTAVLFDNNGSVPPERLYIYTDPDYDRFYSEACSISGDRAFPSYADQKSFAEEIALSLKVRGFRDVSTVDDEGLADILKETVESPSKLGLLVSSFSLPSTVYSGGSDDLLMKWIRNGGSLYWAGSEIGKIYKDSDGLHKVDGNQTLFFGKDGVLNTSYERPTEYVSTEVVDNMLFKALALRCGNTKFGLNINGMDGIQAGFVQNGHATVSIVSIGKGSICIVGGINNMEQRDDLCQTIASGITGKTVVESISNGDVTRKTVERTIPVSCDDPYLYVYFGGIFVTQGKVMHDERVR